MKHLRMALRPLIALVLLVLPVTARTLWFYRGRYAPSTPPALPAYDEIRLATPPLATPAAGAFAVDADEKVVLLDRSHANQFSMPELDALVALLNTSGAQLEVLDEFGPYLSQAFAYADAYVVIAPTQPFTPLEVQAVERFVERGGRLLVITDPTRNGVPFEEYEYALDQLAADVVAANGLLRPFDLAFADDYLYNLVENEANYRNIFFREFGTPVDEDLEAVAFYAAHSLHTRSGTPLLIGDDATLSSRTDTGGGLLAAAQSAGGDVIALGDLTFMTPPYHQVLDNGRLIAHLAQFLLEGTRTRNLEDFPYLFEGPVAVLPLLETFALDVEMLETFAPLQRKLELLDIDPQLVAAPPEGADLVVLGTYAPDDDLAPYLEPFDLDLSACATAEGDEESDAEPRWAAPSDGEQAPPPAFPFADLGDVACDGTGLMLYTRDEARATLVLLAGGPQGVLTLLEILASGDLSPCVVQGEIGVCSVGVEEEELGDDLYPFPYEEPTEAPIWPPEPTPEGTPEPTPEGTPEITPEVTPVITPEPENTPEPTPSG
jgi:hypothetical protein